MSEIHQWFNEKSGLKVVAALKKNRFNAEYVATREEARQRILAMVPKGASIGVGGSLTLKQLQVFEELAQRGHELFDHTDKTKNVEERNRMRRLQLTSDVFLTGTNAVTLSGQLVNEDNTGNRVAAMIYGPQKVIIAVGVNKIVKDVDSALERIERYAAPLNNYQLAFPNPCTKTGFCSDCQSEHRICNVITILRKKPAQTDITVLIIGEELGL